MTDLATHQAEHDKLTAARTKLQADIAAARAHRDAVKAKHADATADAHIAGEAPPPADDVVAAEARVASLEAAVAVVEHRHGEAATTFHRLSREAAAAEARAEAETYHARVQQLVAIVQAAAAAHVELTGRPLDFHLAVRERSECFVSTSGKLPATMARIAELRGEARKHGGDFDGDALLNYREATDMHRTLARNHLAALFEA